MSCKVLLYSEIQSGWNVMAHADAREGKWRGNWRMEWVASTLHTTSEHGVSSITTADAHTSAASSRLNWRPRLFKWTRPFRRKTKSGFCACAITFQKQSTACPLCNIFWHFVSQAVNLLQLMLRANAKVGRWADRHTQARWKCGKSAVLVWTHRNTVLYKICIFECI